MREQWKQGLQWGSVAWLGYILWHTIPDAVGSARGPDIGMAALWILVALMLTFGVRHARAVLGGAILAQIVTGTFYAASYGGPMPVAWLLKYWLPMSLPLVPLLFMAPERPRLTVALALVGRWRDAYATLAGWRWPLVAYVVVLTNHEVWDLLLHLEQHQMAIYRTPVFDAALVIVAAVPRERATASAA